MLPVMTAIIEAMPKNRRNCIEYTHSQMHTASSARAVLSVAPRENRKVSRAIRRFEPMTALTPLIHAEPKIASRRTGRDVTSPVLRALYMKLNTAIAVSMAIIKAITGDARTAL